ncbi:MAG TPA: hypothetical protein VLE73_06780 [Candidatus Saccharimonadales bacterium]|nr:hypothetical protein [Candidatus Saccharimonadales bacterium]
MAAGAAAATLAAGHYAHTDTAPVAAPAPQELRVDGAIDMGAVYDSLKPNIASITPANVTLDAAGVQVIKLGEYVATPGQAATDGQAEFVNTSPLLPGEASKKLDKIVVADAKTLNLLAWQGKLASVEFNMAVDPNEAGLKDMPAGDMRFLPAGTKGATLSGAVVQYTLPAKGVVPLQTVAEMTNHEAKHVEQRSLAIVDKFDKAEQAVAPAPVAVDIDAYRADITALRDASVNAAEHNPAVIAAAKNVLAATAHDTSAVAKAQRTVAQSIINGTFNKLQPTEKSPSIVGDFTIDAGRTDLPSYVVAKANLTEDQYKQKTKQQKTASNALDAAFYKALQSEDSPQSIFYESSYGISDAYSHADSNTSELIDGAEDALQTHPQQLAAKLKRFPAAIQQTALRLIKRVNADTQRADKTGYVSTATKELHAQLNDNEAWLEKTLNNTEPGK